MDQTAMRPLELVAAGALLRPWRDDDIEDLWSALQDPEIRLWNGSGSASRDEARRFIENRQDWSTGDHASWAMVDPSRHRLLGSMSLHRIDATQASAEIGYWTSPSARGRGIATQTA